MTVAIATSAWVITHDHLVDDMKMDVESAIGMTGPHGAPSELIDKVSSGRGHVFRMYDDDGEHYYSGRLAFTGDYPEERELIDPLREIGLPMGAVLIKFHGKPEWEIYV